MTSSWIYMNTNLPRQCSRWEGGSCCDLFYYFSQDRNYGLWYHHPFRLPQLGHGEEGWASFRNIKKQRSWSLNKEGGLGRKFAKPSCVPPCHGSESWNRLQMWLGKEASSTVSPMAPFPLEADIVTWYLLENAGTHQENFLSVFHRKLIGFPWRRPALHHLCTGL